LKGSRFFDTVLLIFFILAAVIIGALVGEALKGVEFLKWLSFGGEFGFGGDGPLLSFAIFKLWFGFTLKINVLQIILITAAMFIYRKVR